MAAVRDAALVLVVLALPPAPGVTATPLEARQAAGVGQVAAVEAALLPFGTTTGRSASSISPLGDFLPRRRLALSRPCADALNSLQSAAQACLVQGCTAVGHCAAVALAAPPPTPPVSRNDCAVVGGQGCGLVMGEVACKTKSGCSWGAAQGCRPPPGMPAPPGDWCCGATQVDCANVPQNCVWTASLDATTPASCDPAPALVVVPRPNATLCSAEPGCMFVQGAPPADDKCESHPTQCQCRPGCQEKVEAVYKECEKDNDPWERSAKVVAELYGCNAAVRPAGSSVAAAALVLGLWASVVGG